MINIYRGFNVVLTALLYIAFVGGSYHLVKKFNSPLAVGVDHNDNMVSTFCFP